MPLNVTPFLSPALSPPPADQTRRPDSFEKLLWAPLKQEMCGEHDCLWQEDTATVIQRAELRAAEHAIFTTQRRTPARLRMRESDACAVAFEKMFLTSLGILYGRLMMKGT